MVGIYHDRQHLDAASRVCVLNYLFKPLMLGVFTTLAGRLFQESTTRWVKVCLPNKSRLLSFNSMNLVCCSCDLLCFFWFLVLQPGIFTRIQY